MTAQPSGIQADDDLVSRRISSLLEPLNKKGVKLTRDVDLVADLEIMARDSPSSKGRA